jgi:hypothetical protein
MDNMWNLQVMYIKQLYHEKFCLENKVLHLLFYYEWKFVGFMKDHKKEIHICTKNNNFITILEFIVNV